MKNKFVVTNFFPFLIERERFLFITLFYPPKNFHLLRQSNLKDFADSILTAGALAAKRARILNRHSYLAFAHVTKGGGGGVCWCPHNVGWPHSAPQHGG